MLPFAILLTIWSKGKTLSVWEKSRKIQGKRKLKNNGHPAREAEADCRPTVSRRVQGRRNVVGRGGGHNSLWRPKRYIFDFQYPVSYEPIVSLIIIAIHYIICCCL